MEGVRVGDLGLPGRRLHRVRHVDPPALGRLDRLRVGAGDGGGLGVVDRLEEPARQDLREVRLLGGPQHVLAASEERAGVGDRVEHRLRRVAERIGDLRGRDHEARARMAVQRLHERHEEGDGLLGQRRARHGPPARRLQVAGDLIDQDQPGGAVEHLFQRMSTGCRERLVVELHVLVEVCSPELEREVAPDGRGLDALDLRE